MTDRDWYWAAIISILFYGCYEPEEGCLDPLAINYDVTADINADCTYPALDLAFSHNWEDEPFSYDSTYLDAAGQPFRITFMGFFLRSFEVELVNGGKVPVSTKTNTVLLQNGLTYTYLEEIILVEDRNFQSSIDSITIYEPWTAISAQVGLEELSMVDSAALPNNHPLNRRNAMSPGGADLYYDYVISFLPDTGDMESRRWVYGQLQDSFKLTFPKDTLFEPAVNAELTFDLYYDQLFNGFTREMTDQAIKELWEQNLPSAIEVR